MGLTLVTTGSILWIGCLGPESRKEMDFGDKLRAVECLEML